MPPSLLPCLLLLAACPPSSDDDTQAGNPDTYDQEDFTQDLLEAMCAKADECGWLVELGWTLEECLQHDISDTAEDDCAVFDPVAAHACIAAIEATTCDEYAKGVGFDICDDACTSG